MMGMYSKELHELDLGTIDYMIDEMQNTIDAQKEQLNQKDMELCNKEALIQELQAKIAELSKSRT
ncbi:MAG: hypothetical protein ACI4BB_12710 [Coprococcus sp.]